MSDSGNWFKDEFERARARHAATPDRHKLVVTRPQSEIKSRTAKPKPVKVEVVYWIQYRKPDKASWKVAVESTDPKETVEEYRDLKAEYPLYEWRVVKREIAQEEWVIDE